MFTVNGSIKIGNRNNIKIYHIATLTLTYLKMRNSDDDNTINKCKVFYM